MAIPRHLNGTEFSSEVFQYNIIFRYGIVTLKLPMEYDGCGRKFLVQHSLSCPKEGIFLALYNNMAKEWGALLAWALNQLCISYNPKIIIRIVQGEKNRDGAWIAMGG